MTPREEAGLEFIRGLLSWGFTSNGYPMFGSVVRLIREEAGLGLREAAVALGLTATKLSKIERMEQHEEHIQPEASPEEFSALLNKIIADADAIRSRSQGETNPADGRIKFD